MGNIASSNTGKRLTALPLYEMYGADGNDCVLLCFPTVSKLVGSIKRSAGHDVLSDCMGICQEIEVNPSVVNIGS